MLFIHELYEAAIRDLEESQAARRDRDDVRSLEYLRAAMKNCVDLSINLAHPDPQATS